jgi:hypothetical protein
MFLRKHWRELYLTISVSLSIAITIAATLFLSDLLSLGVIAAGVFISVLGVGFYDQAQQAELEQVRIKTRR